MKTMFLFLALFVSSTTVLASSGMVINSVKRPYNGYGEWVVYLNDAGKNEECRFKSLSGKGSHWIIECPDANYRITQTFKDHFKITREGEESGYINEAGYYIHTQLDEIRPMYKNEYNQWQVQGTNTILSASFSDLKEWKAYFFDLKGAKEGEMLMTWPFTGLTEIKFTDNYPAISEKQKKQKFLVVFATIISTIKAR